MSEVYTPQMIERLQFFADNPTPLVSKGVISDTRVSKYLGVSRETVRRWKTPCAGFAEYYKKEFADCIAGLQAKFDSGDIKRSMIERARGFTQLKVVREPVEEGPTKITLAGLTKPALQRYASGVLKLELSPDLTEDAMRAEIELAWGTMTKKKMVVIKKETVTQAGDVGAAKLVLANIDNGGWNVADLNESKHGVSDGLADLMREISGRSGLPIKD